MLQNDNSNFGSFYLFYHDVAIFIKTSLLIHFCIAKSHFASEYPYSYFTLILFVSLSHLFALCSRGYCWIYRGLMFSYRSLAREVAAPNQWNAQIISISFSTHRSLSHEEKSYALEAILAVLMVCIIHIGEPNRIEIPSPPTMSFHPDVRLEFKKILSLMLWKKLLSYRNAISRISYTDTYHKPQWRSTP